ncbi:MULTISPECIES: hypothetical protein [Acidovorax]|uniref:Uncharacterized protein n=1 Tax=Acidovorax facilis TaxID=12917 RepID=A0ABV8DHH1_9BURK|nr:MULTISPECIES: hypothetical protein [Acidovorax]KQB57435.1 hypothetical protein AE621_20890 [Acidovorax sp. SD340]MBO1010871.1 hypothetical protein [Acidovorax sp. SD340]MCO4244887.1 hypothetical protein [Acidovorax facilis]
MKVTFILKNLADQFYECNGGSIPGLLQLSDEDKFKKLNKMSLLPECSHNCTMQVERGAFRDQVELNQLLRRSCAFTCKIDPRRGYKLATFEITELRLPAQHGSGPSSAGRTASYKPFAEPSLDLAEVALGFFQPRILA